MPDYLQFLNMLVKTFFKSIKFLENVVPFNGRPGNVPCQPLGHVTCPVTFSGPNTWVQGLRV